MPKQSRTEKDEYHANRESRELTQETAQIRMSARVEGVACSGTHLHGKANYPAKTSRRALGSQEAILGVARNKKEMCRIEVFQGRKAIGKNPDHKENAINGQLCGTLGPRKYEISEKYSFGKPSGLPNSRLRPKRRQRARQVPASGAGHGSKSVRRRRRTKSDSVRRHFLSASGADAGQSTPPETVSATFWTVSGASFWRLL